jgi:arylsulfatase A-like enzyme
MNGLARRTLWRTVLAGVAVAGLTPWLAAGYPLGAPAADARRPNIVVVLTDDMGFSDLGCYGGEIHTPNLDQLAAGGLRFTQFYNTARCCPTRASLLTGLYPHQAAVGHMMENKGLDGYHGDLSRNAVTIAEVLRTAGYATYATGKWHVTPFDRKGDSKHNWPLQRGFARYYGIIGGAANYFDPDTLVRDNTPIKASADPAYEPEHYYLTDAISDHASRFVQDHARQKPGQPFFLYVAFTAAHWPLHAPESEIAKYKGKYDGGYEPIRQAHLERLRRMGIIQPGWDLSPQDGDWSKVARKAWEARCMEVYAAQVDRMDQGVGKIVETLTKNQLLENTLILYLQDNGACAENVGRAVSKAGVPAPMPGAADTFIAYGQAWANVSNTPLRYYKHFVHEGGISTPLIAHWPAGITRRGELEHQPGHLIDVMTTCVDLAGAKYPAEFAGKTIQPMEGRSLAPAFHGQAIQREAIFWEHEGNRALRVGKWKLVAKGPRGPWELYDMEKDRTEMHDLAGAQPERVREMTSLWEKWAKRTQAVPWPWGKPYGEEKPQPKAKKTKTGKAKGAVKQ